MIRAEKIYLEHIGWLFFPPGDEVLRFLREGWFEHEELAFEIAFLRPGDKFLDIGTHVGLHAAVAARMIGPSGEIICIEPNTALHIYIQANLPRDQPKHIIRPYAIAGQSGTSPFVIQGEERTAYSYLDKDGSTADGKHSSEVRTLTLPDFWRQEHLTSINLIKVDIEGAELELFQSAESFLESIDAPFLVEFSEENLQRNGADTRELESVVRRMGFVPCLYDANQNRIEPAMLDHPVWYQNYILCRDPELINQRLEAAHTDQLERARDLFAKGRAAYELYLQNNLMRSEAPHIEVVIDDLKELNANLTATTVSYADRRGTGETLRDIAASLADTAGRTRSIATDLSTSLASARDRMVKLEAEVSAQASKISNTNNQLDSTYQELEQTRERLESTHKELEQARGRLDSTHQELEKAQNQLDIRNGQLQQQNQHHARALSDAANVIYEIRRTRKFRFLQLIWPGIASKLNRLLESLSR